MSDFNDSEIPALQELPRVQPPSLEELSPGQVTGRPLSPLDLSRRGPWATDSIAVPSSSPPQVVPDFRGRMVVSDFRNQSLHAAFSGIVGTQATSTHIEGKVLIPGPPAPSPPISGDPLASVGRCEVTEHIIESPWLPVLESASETPGSRSYTILVSIVDKLLSQNLRGLSMNLREEGSSIRGCISVAEGDEDRITSTIIPGLLACSPDYIRILRRPSSNISAKDVIGMDTFIKGMPVRLRIYCQSSFTKEITDIGLPEVSYLATRIYSRLHSSGVSEVCVSLLRSIGCCLTDNIWRIPLPSVDGFDSMNLDASLYVRYADDFTSICSGAFNQRGRGYPPSPIDNPEGYALFLFESELFIPEAVGLNEDFEVVSENAKPFLSPYGVSLRNALRDLKRARGFANRVPLAYNLPALEALIKFLAGRSDWALFTKAREEALARIEFMETLKLIPSLDLPDLSDRPVSTDVVNWQTKLLTKERP